MKAIINYISGLQKVLLASLLIMLMAGCEDFFITEADHLKIPGSESKLVVNAYISPQDTLIKVYVNRSTPYMQSPVPAPVYNRAHVLMAPKGGEFVNLHWDEEKRCFVTDAANLEIKPGMSYVLKVESFDGEVVDAECYVPHLEYASLEIDPPTTVAGEWESHEIVVDWRLSAPPENTPNYYSTGAYIKFYHVREYNNPPDTVYQGTSPMSLAKGSSHFFDDNGSTYGFKGKSGYYSSGSFLKTSVDTMFVYILQTDINYYLFHKSVNDYNYFDEDFPFAEAVHIYTNINGGLGVFAGYNRKDFVVPFNK